ncbi:MAG: MBL fold metallo-hydrolase [Polyangiales bacterium]
MHSLRPVGCLLALALTGCPSTPAAPDASNDGALAADATPDAVVTDDGIDGSSVPDPMCPAQPTAPTTAVRPVPGELFYAQLGLGGLQMGESALVVGPDGTRVLIDVGNNSHDDDVADALMQLTGSTVVDHIVITHFHADHGDGLQQLLQRITLRGSIVHRGLTDMTAAANEGTLSVVCNAAAARAGMGVGLCSAAGVASCNPAQWGGQRPATGCPGLATADIGLGESAQLDFVAANGFIGDESFERVVRPILMNDSNGENARSVTAVLRHGAFRMLVAGDLTGGGSDTDAIEGFYASRVSLGGDEARGVDVLHAGHHGRNTSSSGAWVARMLPNDGRSRNVVMGISTAHLRSPHAEVLTEVLSAERLRQGFAWTTQVAAGGATHASLIDADGGRVLIATQQRGATYVMQSVSRSGAVLRSQAYVSVRACR